MIHICSSCVSVSVSSYGRVFDEIMASLDQNEKKAVQKQCGKWPTFVVMDPMTWQDAKRNISRVVQLAAVATDLDVLWQQLHPSQATGPSHSMHSTSYIYRSAIT